VSSSVKIVSLELIESHTKFNVLQKLEIEWQASWPISFLKPTAGNRHSNCKTTITMSLHWCFLCWKM